MTKYKDNTAYGQNNTNYALPVERYAVEGYTPPAGVVGKEAVKEMQRWLGGLTVDGVWGEKTQKQFDKAMAAVLKTTEVPPMPADRERLAYAEDIYKLSLGIGKSSRGNYVVRGYDPPGNIKSTEDVRAFQ
ncbi:MAG TPA: peptidoglycan-binding domain-containing protein, partial [Feifaniaceae bacterium]|nr:peptidoglycan-binding domain-containing protein [Feifaniaceae bacterium]